MKKIWGAGCSMRRPEKLTMGNMLFPSRRCQPMLTCNEMICNVWALLWQKNSMNDCLSIGPSSLFSVSRMNHNRKRISVCVLESVECDDQWAAACDWTTLGDWGISLFQWCSWPRCFSHSMLHSIAMCWPRHTCHMLFGIITWYVFALLYYDI